MKSEFSLTCLFLIILSVYSSVAHDADAHASRRRYNHQRDVPDYKAPELLTKYTEYPSKTVQYQVNEHNNKCNCTYSSGKDSNIRKNVEEIIRVLLQDSSATRVESGYDVNRDIRDTADEIILQLSIKIKEIAKKIDIAIKEKQLLAIIENINDRLAALEHATDSSTRNNNEVIPMNYNVTKPGNETSNTINRCNITVPDSVKTYEGTREALEKLSEDDLDRFMANKTAPHTNLKQSKTVQYNVTKSENGTNNAVNMCNITVPDSVKIKKDIWRNMEIPLEDDLDRYMINTTGCKYRADKYWKMFSTGSVLYNGTRVEWRGAVRSAGPLLVRMYGPNERNHNFYFGEDTRDGVTTSRSSANTGPTVFSDEHYKPIYIKIDAGILSFGTECDGKTVRASDFPVVRQGQLINIEIYPGTSFGMKWLYDWPFLSVLRQSDPGP